MSTISKVEGLRAGQLGAVNIILMSLITARIFLDAFSETSILVDYISISVGLLFFISAISRMSHNTYYLKEKKDFKYSISLLIFISYIIFSGIPVFGAIEDSNTFIKYVLSLVLFIQGIRWAKRLEKDLILKFRTWIINALVVNSMIALFEFSSKSKLAIEKMSLIPDDRYSGFILWPNIASTLYGIAILSLLIEPEKKKLKLIKLLLLVIGQIVAGVLAGFISLIMCSFVFLLFFKEGLKKKALILTPLVAYLITLTSNVIDSSRFRDFMYNFIDSSYNSSTESFTWRLDQWAYLIELIRERAFFGYGFASAIDIRNFRGYLPHNDYLRVVLELGVIGLLWGIYLLSLYFYNIRRHASRANKQRVIVVIYVLLCAIGQNLLGQILFSLILPIFLPLEKSKMRE